MAKRTDKIRKCNYKDCEEPRRKKPGNNTFYFSFCHEHLIESILDKQKTDKKKDSEGLEKARKSKGKTSVERFYTSSAWKNCSRYVLLYYSDSDLMVRCSTSPHLIYRITDKEIHCGHYHKADQHKAVAFEFKNLCPQSYSDNVHFSGKPEKMAQWIENTHGEGTLDWLDKKKNETYKLDKYELDRISKYYLDLLNKELKRRNIKNPWN